MADLNNYHIINGITVQITDHSVHEDAKLEFHVASNGFGISLNISDEKTYCNFGKDWSYEQICFDDNNKLAFIHPSIEDINKKAELTGTTRYGTLLKTGELGGADYNQFRYLNKHKKYYVVFNKAEDLQDSELVLFHKDFGCIFKNKQYAGWYLQNPLNYLCNDEIKPNIAFDDVRDEEYDFLEMFLNTFGDNDFYELYDDADELAVVLWEKTVKMAPMIKNKTRRKIFVDAARNYYHWQWDKYPEEN